MNPKEYWNRKIIGWEFARYSWMGSINPASWSVRNRMDTAVAFLESLLRNQSQLRILELGCGSGALAEKLTKHSGVRYSGFDIAEVAIQKAKRKLGSPQFSFFTSDIVTEDNFPAADVAVLLGVTDWISPEVLRQLLTRIAVKNVLISFTEKKMGPRGGIYAFYRLLKDMKTGQTETFTSLDFSQLCQDCGWIIEKDLTNKMMLPGRLLWLKKSTSI